MYEYVSSFVNSFKNDRHWYNYLVYDKHSEMPNKIFVKQVNEIGPSDILSVNKCHKKQKTKTIPCHISIVELYFKI